MSSAENKLRGLGLMPPNHIVPVIVVPGIMGTNLRARRKLRRGGVVSAGNKPVVPGQPVWRPPNGKIAGYRESSNWDQVSARSRQQLLDPANLEVDDDGPVILPDQEDGYVLTELEVRQRGWGEVHADSYGLLLYALQTRLNQTFGFDDIQKKRFIKQHWKDIMTCDPRQWGLREREPLTEPELEKHAKFYFPTYSFGYNWLQDCEISSRELEKRIVAITDSWRTAKRRCDKVILVTHSMGGLVARACAKRIPDKIAGVIHGAMPALGAPVAYRRIACGTETSSPSNDPLENLTSSRVAKILGDTPEKTTPVLATSAGALELLPNHLYPQPWLHVRVIKSVSGAQAASHAAMGDVGGYRTTPYDALHLPNAKMQNPYDLYRDTKSWYRLINPALVDPAAKYVDQDGGVEKVIETAINTAEAFHRSLGDYYHPNTYAFYGDDKAKLSFGRVRWVAFQRGGAQTALTSANLATATYLGHNSRGQRRVLVEGKTELHFAPEMQDARGDGTVPHHSGARPAGRVKQVFATGGYDHQESYKNDNMIMLTLRLIVKIAQGIS